MIATLSFLAQLLLGLFVADFLGGVVHWIEDRYGDPDCPILGPLVFAPNQLHHQKPIAFTLSSFVARNGTAAVAALAIGLPAILLLGPAPWLVTALLLGSVTNEVHCWAHRPNLAPAWARQLQRIGLLQSQRHHAKHHAPPHTQHYCALTDWLNPILDRAHFWRRLETLLARSWAS